MSSIASRVPMRFLRCAQSSAVNATAGPSYTTGKHARSFSATSSSCQAIAVSNEVFVPFDQRALGQDIPARFLINVSTPVSTTSTTCTGGPVANIKAHLTPSSSHSLILYRPGVDSTSPSRQGFKRLMQEVRRSETSQGSSGLGKWFWAERASEGGQGDGMKVLVDQVVSEDVLGSLQQA